MLDKYGEEIVFRANVVDVMHGKDRFDLPLHHIHEVKEQLTGKELEPENIVLLLRARIAELDWFFEEANCFIHGAKEHVKKLEKGIHTH